MNIMIWQGDQGNFATEIHCLPIAQTMKLLDSESRNSGWLKDILKGLVGKTITWNILEADQSCEWGVFTFLSEAKLSQGQIEYRFNPAFVERVIEAKVWAKFRILMQLKLKKRHSMVIYEYLIDALNRGRKQEMVLIESVANLRQILHLNDGEYQEYKFLNQFVLKPAMAEINQVSDLKMSYKGLRTGRRVTSIEFTAKKQDDAALGIIEDSSVLTDLPLFQSEHATESPSLKLLVRKGVERKKAQDLLASYDEQRVLANLAYVENLQQSGKTIKSFPAYLIRAVEQDYALPSSEPDTSLEVKWRSFQRKRAEQYFDELSKVKQREMKAGFIAKLEQTPKDIVTQQYRILGWRNELVKREFFEQCLKSFLSEPEEIDFEAYCDWIKRGKQQKAA